MYTVFFFFFFNEVTNAEHARFFITHFLVTCISHKTKQVYLSTLLSIKRRVKLYTNRQVRTILLSLKTVSFSARWQPSFRLSYSTNLGVERHATFTYEWVRQVKHIVLIFHVRWAGERAVRRFRGQTCGKTYSI